MAQTKVSYTGDGSAVLFSIPFPYLEESDLLVTVDGGTVAYTFPNSTTVEFAVAPSIGADIIIKRFTADASLKSTITAGAAIRAGDLNSNFLQALYKAQEAETLAGDAQAGTVIDGSIGSSQLANGAVATSKIADGAVTTAKIADSNVTNTKIADSAVSAAKIGTSQVTTVKIDDTAVTTAKLANDAVTTAKLDSSGIAPTVTSINGGPLAGMRNAIINGNFDIWQRGTSHTVGGYGSVDRWVISPTGSTFSTTRQSFTLGQTDVPGEPTFFCRTVVTSVAGASNFVVMGQPVEGVRTLAGQQATVSFWAKADGAKPISVELSQRFGTGGSPSADVNALGVTKVVLSTSWQKITTTVTLPSIAGKTLGSDSNDLLYLFIWFDAGSDLNARTDTLGQQSGTFDIAQVQVEAGPVATPFERRSIGTELALCQRYFQVYTGSHFGCNSFKYMAGARTTSFNGGGAYNTHMRTTPTLTTQWNTFTNCTESTHLFDSRSVTFRVDVTAAGNYRATGGNTTLDAEL